jgi:MinD superfamily P-loop ATPase
VLLAVASGKGGTGKTTVAVNLALSLETQVQLLDCDADEPNVHTLLALKVTETKPVTTMVPRFDESKCEKSRACANFCPNNAIFVSEKGITFFPGLCYGCAGCVIACPHGAIEEENRQIGVTHHGQVQGIDVIYGQLDVGEALVVPVIKAVKAAAQKDKDITILDCPPGVSCPLVESVHGSDFCLLVTEPTPFGLHDLKLAVEVIRRLGIPHGVIVNRAGIGDQQVYSYCEEEKIPILLEIPNSRDIAELFSEGIPFVTRMPNWKAKFEDLFHEIQRRLTQ